LRSAAANRALAGEVFAALHSAGVRTVCVCPGGRNAPLVLAAEAARGSFETVSFFEERSAAFFALGRIRRDGAPAAVLTTSGTAAAELLPAMLEAHHSGLRLVAVTADRPRRLRGTGAPQTIDQLPLFTAAHAPVFDLDAPGQVRALPTVDGPVHLNVCFDEPLVDGPVEPLAFPAPAPAAVTAPWMDRDEARRLCDEFFARVRNPLVLVSSLTTGEAAALAPWLASLPCPLYLEALSQLRPRPFGGALRSGERILAECRGTCDGIVRLGGVPTPRFWREAENDDLPLLNISSCPFPGVARHVPVVPLDCFVDIMGRYAPGGADNSMLFARDRRAAENLEKLLAKEPTSEAGLVRWLSEKLPSDARVLLGNSLPIRLWDLAAVRRVDSRAFCGVRGVNGIDGLVSTTLGLAAPDRPVAGIVGDLSALYDLAGLWPAPQLAGCDITLAVINNGGGMIFRRMFNHPAFLNAHRLGLRGWAEMFGWEYVAVRGPGDPIPARGPRIVEIVPDADATARFSAGYDALWR
jgi:2-succinyl-5-enolpyruvyl-6-hydroxy-3-cyclohexene-1-carboxylate synthase